MPAVTHAALELLATPQPFRRWLTERPLVTVVGGEGCHRCPLARFLQNAHPDVDWRVGLDELWVGRGSGTPLPAWARRFVRLADAFMSARAPDPYVYAHEALRLLGHELEEE